MACCCLFEALKALSIEFVAVAENNCGIIVVVIVVVVVVVVVVIVVGGAV